MSWLKQLSLIYFFLVGTISANDDIWKPTNDYFIDCSYTAELVRTLQHDDDDIVGDYKVKLYAHYDLDKEKKFVTEQTTATNNDYFIHRNYTAIWEYSDDKNHRFNLTHSYAWDPYYPYSVGVSREWTENTMIKVLVDRENLTMVVPFNNLPRKCSIMTAEEYRTTINDLEKKRDVLIQDFTETRKSRLKL